MNKLIIDDLIQIYSVLGIFLILFLLIGGVVTLFYFLTKIESNSKKQRFREFKEFKERVENEKNK